MIVHDHAETPSAITLKSASTIAEITVVRGLGRRFGLFHGKRHPAELGPGEVGAFLRHFRSGSCPRVCVDTRRRFDPRCSTTVCDVQMPGLDDVAIASTNKKLPVVLTLEQEVRRLFGGLRAECKAW